MADNDEHDEEDRDSDAPDSEPKKEAKAEPKKEAKAEPKPAKVEKRAAPMSEMEQVIHELKEIRALLQKAREEQARYLWILFPIGAILLIQTILYATKF